MNLRDLRPREHRAIYSCAEVVVAGTRPCGRLCGRLCAIVVDRRRNVDLVRPTTVASLSL